MGEYNLVLNSYFSLTHEVFENTSAEYPDIAQGIPLILGFLLVAGFLCVCVPLACFWQLNSQSSFWSEPLLSIEGPDINGGRPVSTPQDLSATV
jgi:hypothetical protein